ncbi:MAG TPA: HU family DNA-binding protein [Myxococcota bacterium]|nr:HU family DNA-binding protein [Myxococcota bacterium]HRY95775.1 HU family DNA-binding protein [Myxococcota bacterium]HSA20528.1 HU family DNA-binding protein [Myxococcota bacterium]
MNKDQMLDGIMRAAGISKANVNRFYEGLVELATKKLQQDGEFVLPGLGVLRVRVQKPREGRNPQTGEKIRIPRKKVVRFGAYKDLKDTLNPGAGDAPELEEDAEEGVEPVAAAADPTAVEAKKKES